MVAWAQAAHVTIKWDFAPQPVYEVQLGDTVTLQYESYHDVIFGAGCTGGSQICGMDQGSNNKCQTVASQLGDFPFYCGTFGHCGQGMHSILRVVAAGGTTPAPQSVSTTAPSNKPTKLPTFRPTKKPTKLPTFRPTKLPTSKPTKKPTKSPTFRPTKASKAPTPKPTKKPTKSPTLRPTKTSKAPTSKPTKKKTV
ncbi:hypothetical protein BASA81_002197 [Batrachochytrium salamandrivorans]|nr:hypothetical protein BASA81_002197 [Batrachochytrium salamandrivorans]